MAYTTINKSTDYFNTKLYTGNGTTQSITGVGFQPDMVWAKCRAGTVNHGLADAVRGATNQLRPNDTTAEFTGGFVSFDADGFSLNNNHNENNNSQSYASWNWKSGGAGSSNTDGSITSTVSANTTAGFSIVKYTGNTTSGATVGHGLGAVPKMIIAKNTTSNSQNWQTYHVSVGNDKTTELDLGNASGSSSAWNSTTPTSTVFTLGNGVSTNGGTMIAYCFAEKTGYSKFGSYVGNGNADGTFVYTGFKPAFILTKDTSATSEWHIYDNKRDTNNPNSAVLSPNGNYAESTNSNGDTDFLSNGFKLRNSNSNRNSSGNTYLYMAFGNTIVGTNNVPCTAR